ncbi:MAG: efflux RND transporter periplasmic adaptor subunit [Planctomycetaceae bacterium]|nr:efflux RND transporter periplasmic adaptor subunit [Planctomycetaceae bacterium]
MKQSRSKIVWLVVSVLGSALGAAAYFGGWLSKDTAPVDAPAAIAPVAKQPDPIAVTLAEAVSRPVERRVRTVGTLHGFEEIEIGPLVDGHVRKVLHDVGDIVRPGETLLEIDDTDLRLAVSEMGRALELELSRLGLTTIPERTFDVTKLPAVLRAQVVEQNAADTFARYKTLAERNAMSQDEFSKAELSLSVARLDTKQRIMEAEQHLAAVRHRQAVLETTQKRLKDTQVVAPPMHVTSGESPSPAYTVSGRMVSPGEIVRAAPPTPLFKLVVEDPLKLQSAVPERFAAQIQNGQTVDLEIEALPGHTIHGRVVRVNPTVDPASRTFQIEIAVPNPERRIKPGSFATASILVDGDAVAVTVPEEAVIRFAGVTKLFTIADTAAQSTPIELGTRLEVRDTAGKTHRWVEIQGSITPGMKIVTSGHAQLVDGSAVRIRDLPPVEEQPTERKHQLIRQARQSTSERKDVR